MAAPNLPQLAVGERDGPAQGLEVMRYLESGMELLAARYSFSGYVCKKYCSRAWNCDSGFLHGSEMSPFSPFVTGSPNPAENPAPEMMTSTGLAALETNEG